MKFRTVHMLASYLMVATALGALAFGGNLDGPVLIIVVLAVALSLFIPEYRQQGAIWHSTWTVATVAALGLCVLQFILRDELVVSTVSFLLFLLVNKLFNRRTVRDYLQLYVLTFMMVVAGSVLNVGISYAVFFVLYTISITWALIMFHLRREMEENYLIKHSTDQRSERVAVDRILNSRRIVGGWFLLGTSVVSLAVFFLAAGVFLFFPRIGTRASSPLGRNPQMLTGFSDRLALGGHGRLRDNPEVVMRVILKELPPGVRLSSIHFRGAVFDRYSKGRWHRSPDAPKPRLIRRGRLLGMSWANLPDEARRDHSNLLDGATRQEVLQEPLGTDLIFTAGQPIAIDLQEKSGSARPGFRVTAGGELRANLAERGGRYVLYTSLLRPTRAKLSAAPQGPIPGSIAATYLTPNDDMPSTVRALGERIAAGRRNTLDRVDAVLSHLGQGFRYSRTLPRTGGRDQIAHFLFEGKSGHCEYFASAMVLLLRAGKVPARVVTGFLGGAWNRYGEYMVVRQGDAHAWVEVWFPSLGWVTFDPTPPSGLEPLPSEGFVARLQMLLDSLRMRWQRWVIDYDMHEQASLIDGLRLRLRRLRSRLDGVGGTWLLWTILGALVGFGILVFLGRRGLRRKGALRQEDSAPRGPALRLAKVLLRWLQGLQLLGFHRAPGETVLELATRLDSALPGLAPRAHEVLGRYYMLRYGKESPSRDEVINMESDMKALLEAVGPRRQELALSPGDSAGLSGSKQLIPPSKAPKGGP
ncbi:MAG: DUF3488 and transglutaminase-like domain-containing protein [Polyangia bacterium]|jgi:hypothetical protein|nr:DUF3488 and transglutaminase-like domain-containing protein [Polyangia bacterium]